MVFILNLYNCHGSCNCACRHWLSKCDPDLAVALKTCQKAHRYSRSRFTGKQEPRPVIASFLQQPSHTDENFLHQPVDIVRHSQFAFSCQNEADYTCKNVTSRNTSVLPDVNVTYDMSCHIPKRLKPDVRNLTHIQHVEVESLDCKREGLSHFSGKVPVKSDAK